MQIFRNRRSVQKCAQNAGSNVLNLRNEMHSNKCPTIFMLNVKTYVQILSNSSGTHSFVYNKPYSVAIVYTCIFDLVSNFCHQKHFNICHLVNRDVIFNIYIRHLIRFCLFRGQLEILRQCQYFCLRNLSWWSLKVYILELVELFCLRVLSSFLLFITMHFNGYLIFVS